MTPISGGYKGAKRARTDAEMVANVSITTTGSIAIASERNTKATTAIADVS